MLGEGAVVHSRQVPPDVVTMYSRVRITDPRSGGQSEITLCYPADADIGVGYVSVLSPMGWSLIGQGVGATVSWPTPSGSTLSAEILGIAFQPEPSGDFAM